MGAASACGAATAATWNAGIREDQGGRGGGGGGYGGGMTGPSRGAAAGLGRGLGTAPPPRHRPGFPEVRTDRKVGLLPRPRRHHPSGTFATGARKQTALGFQQIWKR